MDGWMHAYTKPKSMKELIFVEGQLDSSRK